MDKAEAKQLLAERVSDRIETVSDNLADNPVGVLLRRFEDLHGVRRPFQDEAKEMAELVVPGMYEGTALDPYGSSGKLFGQESFDSANQSLIAQGVLLLSWTMASVILPADGDYFSRTIEQSVAAQYEQLEDMRKAESEAMGMMGDPENFTPISTQINNEFLRDDLIVKKQTAASNHQEVLARCLYHSLISGISVFGHLSLSQAKAYTIQNSITVFDSAHEPVEVIVVDRVPMVVLDETVRRKLIGGHTGETLAELNPSDQFVTVITQQVRVSADMLRINTEIEGIPIDELSFDVPADAPVLIPLPFMFLNETDPYPIGWLTYNRGNCFSYENGELSIEQMVAAAGQCILGLPPGSRVTTEEFRDTPGFSVVSISDAKARLEAIVAPIASNLQQILGRQDKKERQLMFTFGMDFAIQRDGERVTAEEIQKLAQGLQKLFGATYKQLERDYQHRHCRRQFYLAEEQKLVRPVEKKLYTLSLTAGLQTQEAQNEIGKMDQLVARDVQLAQMDAAGGGSFGREATLQWYAQKYKLDVSDKLLTAEEKAEQLGVAQLLSMVRQMGPQAPGMLAQMLAQMTGGGGAAPEAGGMPV